MGMLLAALCAAGGCATGPMGMRLVGQVDHVQLNASVLPIAEAGEPPMGVAVALYFYRLDRPQPVAVSGDVEVALYEGVLPGEQIGQAEPYYRWSFTGEQLAMYVGRDNFGLTSYRIPLIWGNRPPRTSTVTLLVRYTSREGPPIYARPAPLRMGA